MLSFINLFHGINHAMRHVSGRRYFSCKLAVFRLIIKKHVSAIGLQKLCFRHTTKKQRFIQPNIPVPKCLNDSLDHSLDERPNDSLDESLDGLLDYSQDSSQDECLNDLCRSYLGCYEKKESYRFRNMQAT